MLHSIFDHFGSLFQSKNGYREWFRHSRKFAFYDGYAVCIDRIIRECWGECVRGLKVFVIFLKLSISFQLSNTLRCLSVMTSFLMLAALTFKPLMPPKPNRNEGHEESCVEKIIHLDNWRNKKYVIWALAIPSALFGYFVPYVHIVQYVKDILPKNDGSQLVMCIGITSGLGRIIFGKIADFPWVNRILLQQV